MKKLMFIVAGLLFMATVTFAQDSTKVDKDVKTSPEQTQTQNYKQDMIKIQSTDLPEAVTATLAAPQYKGWETSPIYRSKNNDMYVIEMTSGTETKALRFGADGKPILE
ncbi:MAG TPA: hypothetical protein VK666_13810 [Chryseolinea sp.]|nr:hypothetical protein [Chryseolinea sp.]